MRGIRLSPVVHLELHSPDRDAASDLYSELCDWRSPAVGSSGCGYTGFSLGPDLGGGIVECGTDRAIWLPYVEVADVEATGGGAGGRGAGVLRDPRGGRGGGGSVVRSDAG